MSVLMKAMKAAELAKEQAQAGRGDPVGVAGPAAGDSANRAAIRNAFAVKESAAVGGRFARVVGALTLLAVAGIGIYFWLQLRPTSNVVALVPEKLPDANPPPAASPLPAGAAAHEAAVGAAPTAATAATQAATPPDTRPKTPTHAPPPTPRLPEPTPPIRVAASVVEANPAAIEGWQAFKAGDLAAARGAYGRLLAAEPWNKDALHGMAAIALREGRPADAEAFYQRILAADPRDPAAHAGLIGLRARREVDDPAATEGRLKSLLAGQPGSPALHFALGNIYARQGRWREAQEAYFQASTGDPGNPDILFNLAVSLERLHQGELAADFYRRALAASDNRPAGFDRAAAAERLREPLP